MGCYQSQGAPAILKQADDSRRRLCQFGKELSILDNLLLYLFWLSFSKLGKHADCNSPSLER